MQLQTTGLKATNVVVGGDSAGGLATYWCADWFARQLPSALVAAVSDSGMFLNVSLAGGGIWRKNLGWVVSFMNSTDSLDVSCRRALAADPTSDNNNPSACAFPDVVLPHISTPVFVMQGMVDRVIDDISGAGRSPQGRAEAAAEILSRVQAAVTHQPTNAAFLTMCDEHCGQWGTGQNVSSQHPAATADFNVIIDGDTGHTAVAKW